MMMLNLSYLTVTNAKNQLLFHIQSISAASVHSYRPALVVCNMFFDLFFLRRAPTSFPLNVRNLVSASFPFC